MVRHSSHRNPHPDSAGFRVPTWQIFALLAATAGVLAWVNNTLVMTPDVYRHLLGDQLEKHRIDEQVAAIRRFAVWGYATIPIQVAVRVGVTALLVQMFCLLGMIELPFRYAFRAAALAFIANLYGSAVQLLWIAQRDPSTVDAATLLVVPDSLSAVFSSAGGSWLPLLLNHLSLSQALWAVLLFLGLVGTKRLRRWQAAAVVAGVWGSGTLVRFAVGLYVQRLGGL